MTNTDTDVETKKQNPSASYGHPAEVLKDSKLSRDDKITILREWYYDAVRMQESEGENMSGGEPDRLSAVSKALLELGVSPAKEGDPKSAAKSSHVEKARRYLSSAFDALRGKGGAH